MHSRNHSWPRRACNSQSRSKGDVVHVGLSCADPIGHSHRGNTYPFSPVESIQPHPPHQHSILSLPNMRYCRRSSRTSSLATSRATSTTLTSLRTATNSQTETSSLSIVSSSSIVSSAHENPYSKVSPCASSAADFGTSHVN